MKKKWEQDFCLWRRSGKLLLIMKLTFLLSVVLTIQATAAGVAQVKKVSLNLKEASIEKVFNQLEKQSTYRFIYYSPDMKDVVKVNIELKDVDVLQALERSLKGTGLAYEVVDNYIIIKKNAPVVMVQNIPQQDNKITINGVVRDEQGELLPGVTVVIKGSTQGVITGFDGDYHFPNVPKDAILQFSFIGMATQDVPVVGKTTIDVILKSAVSELEDVTVVAFGKQKKESVVASVTTVKPSELKVPSSDFTTALAGRLSGMISYQKSGEPGMDLHNGEGNVDFFVRGVTTFGYKKSPLILIDGVELSASDLSRINPDDIATFSIMKDATATALYGARGANGVILVTTKEGKEGKVNVSVRLETSISKPTEEIDLADPVTYMRLHNEASKTRDPEGVLPYSNLKIDRTQDPNHNPYVYPTNDWQNMLMKDHAINNRMNLNINGGGKTARYYIAAAATKDNGVLKVDKRNNFNSNINLKKYLLRSNININITNTTEGIIRFYTTFDDYKGPIDGGSGMYKKLMKANPVLFPAYYESNEAYKFNKHIMFGNAGEEGNYINPYADMVKGYKDYSRTLVLGQFELKQDLNFLLDGLKVRALANFNRTSSYSVSRQYNPHWYKVSTYNYKTDDYTLTQLNPETGSTALSYSEGDKVISSVTYAEGAINYDKEFNNKHHLSGLLVGQLREAKMANAGSLQESLERRNVGLSGRFTYSFDSRYFGEFNFGYNGSERFSKNERFGFFPSFGLGWVLSNENFWQSLSKSITKMKLKCTYGIVGNDAIGSADQRFYYLSNVNLNNAGRGYNYGSNFDNYIPGISVSRYANDQITWETAKKLNLGLEMDLFDKIAIQADFFTEKRTNIFMERVDIPTTMGFQAGMFANMGEASSKGIDISMDINHSFNKDLWITGRLNFTYAKSEFDKLEEPDYAHFGAPWKSRVGQSISQMYGYVAERLFIDEQDVKNSPKQFGNYAAGDIKYKDINKDGKITELDEVPIGYPTSPEIVYGFGSSMGYKGLDFSFFFQGLARRSFWIDTHSTAPFVTTSIDGATGNNALLQVYADHGWLEERQDPYAIWPRLSTNNIENNQVVSTWFMRNGAFLRLKSVELGYTLPQAGLKKFGVEKLRLYVSGTNLLTFSEFDLWDVEMGGNGLSYPIQRVFNMGVQVSF